MPSYSFKNTETGEEFEEFFTIANREKFLEQKAVSIVVQINGKKRGLIECEKDILEKDLIKIIYGTNEINKYFNENEIQKKIYVKNKIINFILK